MAIGQFMPVCADRIIPPVAATMTAFTRVRSNGPSYTIPMEFGSGEGTNIIAFYSFTTGNAASTLAVGGMPVTFLAGNSPNVTGSAYSCYWLCHVDGKQGVQNITCNAASAYVNNCINIAVWRVTNLQSITPTQAYATQAGWPHSFNMTAESGGVIFGVASSGRAVNGVTNSWGGMEYVQGFGGDKSGYFPAIFGHRHMPDGGTVTLSVSANETAFPVCAAIAMR